MTARALCLPPREDRDELRAILARDSRLRDVIVIPLGPRPLDAHDLIARVNDALVGVAP